MNRTPRWIPWTVTALFAAMVLASLHAPKSKSPFDVAGFGELPVLNGGRLKPMDTVARTALLEISGKQTVKTEDGASLSAIQWLLDVLFRPDAAANVRCFQIDDPDVLGLMGIEQKTQRLFSFADIEPHADVIEKQTHDVESIKPEQRSRFQSAVVALQGKLTLYERLLNTLEIAGTKDTEAARQRFATEVAPLVRGQLQGNGTNLPASLLKELDAYRFLNQVAAFYPVPLGGAARDPNRWVAIGGAVLGSIDISISPPVVLAYARLGDAWRSGDPLVFNETLRLLNTALKVVPSALTRGRAESVFNAVAPFYQSLLIYLVVFIIVFVSWLIWPETLGRVAYHLLWLAFAIHTTGLVARMIFQGRPPVTNLYSSAIFVGWIAVFLGLFLERLYRNGIGSMVASVIGFLTLIIAHHLASSGDTLEIMRAVLDSNFWLATHVVSITVGYGSTFLAGFLGILYILRRLWDRRWDDAMADSLERMAYGIVCFALFFSFVGTILGGIWADQSWGRFWGWDPKENGALIIVIWNAFILHARLGGYARGRAFMAMAVFGNIVTALSWFGVNMLGIGLHSYGFMDKAFKWLVIFAVLQVGIIALSGWPQTSRRPSPDRSV